MKKVLLATTLAVLAVGSASAADIRPTYRPAPPPPPAYSWTGLYWGANVGYSWGHAKHEETILLSPGPGAFATTSESQKIDGVIGGVQSGYNYQFGAWVWGWETDIQASGQKGGSTFQLAGLPLTTLTSDHKLEWFGTARSRLGVLWGPTVLLYGTAGVAYGQVKDTNNVTTVGVGSVIGTFRDVKAGWTAGAGIEGVLGGGWSAKLEYLYIDLGKTENTIATPGLGTLVSETRRYTDNIVRVGLNYKWGGGGSGYGGSGY
jgi:outer membrane immunogenic protein